VLVNSGCRLLPVSPRRRPAPIDGDTKGLLNCPSAVPKLLTGEEVSIIVELLDATVAVLATKTFPLPSTATATALLNCPSAVPRLPHLVAKVQSS